MEILGQADVKMLFLYYPGYLERIGIMDILGQVGIKM